MPITQETVNLWYNPNVILQGMDYTVLRCEGARVWNKLNLSFRSAGSAQKFQSFKFLRLVFSQYLLQTHFEKSTLKLEKLNLNTERSRVAYR